MFGNILISVLVILLVALFSAGILYWLVVRPWLLRWGATDADVRRPLPGDDLVPHPKTETTHAITIRASAAEVWPWLVQIGYKRAGWYSYDFTHRVLGCAGSVDDGCHSANRIIPELQHLEIGDGVEVGPGMAIRLLPLSRARLSSYTSEWTCIPGNRSTSLT